MHLRLIAKAQAQLSKGNSSEAASLVRQVLEEDASQLGALELLSRALWASQDFAELERVTRQLIRLNPYEPGYFGLRGMALRALGRYGEATRALQRDPASAAHLADLEAFQESLVKERIANDIAFSAAYAKNPELAVASLGCKVSAKRASVIAATANKSRAIASRQRC